jgi:predicted metalloendopeptidase
VGHEITHGFDDEGRQFDVDGNVKDWWSPAVGKAFVEKAECVKKQYDAYVAIEDIKVKGDLTLGENIADLGGLKVAYDALQARLAKDPQETIDGFTAEQRFYLGWAQVWRRNWTDAALKLQVNTGPHAPGKFRVNGPLSNLPTFKAAFGCQDGDPMVRPQATRVAIW